jgi:hypothetical protein
MVSVSEIKVAMPCFKCGKTLLNVWYEGNQPQEGVNFTTCGHYGTKVFDPMDGTELHISICDDCLKENSDKVVHATPIQSAFIQKYNYKPWKQNGTPDSL